MTPNDRLNEIIAQLRNIRTVEISTHFDEADWTELAGETTAAETEVLVAQFPCNYHEEVGEVDFSGSITVLTDDGGQSLIARLITGDSQYDTNEGEPVDVSEIITNLEAFVNSRLTPGKRAEWEEQLGLLAEASLFDDLGALELPITVEGFFPCCQDEAEAGHGETGYIRVYDRPDESGNEAVCGVSSNEHSIPCWEFTGSQSDVLRALGRFFDDGTIPESE